MGSVDLCTCDMELDVGVKKKQSEFVVQIKWHAESQYPACGCASVVK